MKAPLIVAFVILSCLVGSSETTHSVSPTCGYGAAFVNNQCRCRDTFVGEPDFYCYKPENVVTCRLKCDPELNRFDNKNATLYLLASNVLANVKTKLGAPFVGGNCHLSVQSWSARFKGKFYIRAVEFHLRVTYGTGKFIYIWGRIITWVKKSSTGKLIYYWHIFFYSHKLKKYVPFKLLATAGTGSCFKKFTGCTVLFRVCPKSKFLVVIFKGCGLQFGIRPYNPFKPNIPGVWLTAPANAFFPFDLLQSLCGKPQGDRDIDHVRKEYGFDTRKQLLTFLAITYKYSPLYYQNAPSNLKFLKLALIGCPKPFIADFFRKGEFLFKNAALIRCLGPPRLEPLINAILNFVKAFCVRNAHSKSRCYAAVQWVKTKCPSCTTRHKLKRYLYLICLGL